MRVLKADTQAAALLAEHGPPEAWQRATRKAIDAHMAGRIEERDHWTAVQHELARIAPRPGPGDLDVYRAAKLLITQHGATEAWRFAVQRAADHGGDLRQEALSLRIADAVTVLSARQPGEGRTVS